GVPGFITESRFTASSGCHSLDVLDGSGRVVQSIPFDKKFVGLVLPAPEARRFCVDVVRSTGGSNFFDISTRITDASLICFDSMTLRQIGSLPLPSKHYEALSLTISPDASKAAFIEGETVKIMDLPEEGSGTTSWVSETTNSQIINHLTRSP